MNNSQLYEGIIKFIRTMCDNNVHPQAVMNSLNSKIAWMVSLRGVRFRQYSNSKAMPLTYYGFNFVPSGSHKDYVIRLMNDYLFDFGVKFMLQRLEEEVTKENAKPEKERFQFRTYNCELANPNYTGLYQEAIQQQKIGGSLFIRIGELGDYIEGIASGNLAKKELYSKLKDIYDGDIYPNVIAMDRGRQPVLGIPIQCLMYSDLDPIKNSKVKKAIMTSFRSGMARRSFIFVPKESKTIMNYPLDAHEKEIAITSSCALRDTLLKRFYAIPPNSIYMLSREAMGLLDHYRQECIDFFNAYDEEEIIRIERKESWWKILKLSIILGILAEPQNLLVDAKYVQQAIDFNASLGTGLSLLINLRSKDDFDIAIQFFRSRADGIAERTELRRLGVGQGDFTKWLLRNEELLAEELEVCHGLKLVPYGASGSKRGWQVLRVKRKEEE